MNNDLIRMLSDQAREHADTFDDVGTPIWLFQYNKFFAELLIRECADHLEVEYGQSALTGNAAAKSVKKHFGVEE